MSASPDHRVKFTSNNCVAVHVPDLDRAQEFYSNTLGLSLKEERPGCLVYDSGLLELYIVKDENPRPPVPSFTVPSLSEARRFLESHGCRIVKDDGGSLYFQEPGGTVFDLIEKRDDAA
jgi:catechol 2,3-dioxygenase-like lactoylglutathione lyase family enzyme